MVCMELWVQGLGICFYKYLWWFSICTQSWEPMLLILVTEMDVPEYWPTTALANYGISFFFFLPCLLAEYQWSILKRIVRNQPSNCTERSSEGHYWNSCLYNWRPSSYRVHGEKPSLWHQQLCFFGPAALFLFSESVNHHVGLLALNSRKFGAHLWCGLAIYMTSYWAFINSNPTFLIL